MPGIPIADARHFLCAPVRGAGQTVLRGRGVAAQTSEAARRDLPGRQPLVGIQCCVPPMAFASPTRGALHWWL